MKKRKAGSVYMAHARTDAQRKNMERIRKDKVNPFDWKHLERYHAEPILRKGRYWLVTPNDYPYEGTSLHLLLIYKDDVRLPSETSAKAWPELQKHIAWIEKTYKVKGGSLLMRFGEPSMTGGSVHHLHLHVIVGTKHRKGAKKLKVTAGYEVKKNVRRPKRDTARITRRGQARRPLP
jgi:ATP adenylyltransferase